MSLSSLGFLLPDLERNRFLLQHHFTFNPLSAISRKGIAIMAIIARKESRRERKKWLVRNARKEEEGKRKRKYDLVNVRPRKLMISRTQLRINSREIVLIAVTSACFHLNTGEIVPSTLIQILKLLSSKTRNPSSPISL